MPSSTSEPLLPAGIGITRLKVYDTDSPDGLIGGSPHFHLLCTELYVVLAGSGEVETLSGQGIQRHSLVPGKLVWFEPGVVHRLLNPSGDLDILVVMQNQGLPEAGDFVLAFPKAILADDDSYRRHVSLASGAYVYATDQAAATARRDLATKGYLEWKGEFETRGEEALRELFELGLQRVMPQLGRWQELVAQGPVRALAQTESSLRGLGAGDLDYLLSARSAERVADPETRLGMCGHLTVYPFLQES